MKIFRVTLGNDMGIFARKLVPAKSRGHAAQIMAKSHHGYGPFTTSVVFAYDDECYDDLYRKYRPIY